MSTPDRAPIDVERLLAVVASEQQRLKADPNVIGVGYGPKIQGDSQVPGVAIRYSVRSKIAEGGASGTAVVAAVARQPVAHAGATQRTGLTGDVLGQRPGQCGRQARLCCTRSRLGLCWRRGGLCKAGGWGCVRSRCRGRGRWRW